MTNSSSPDSFSYPPNGSEVSSWLRDALQPAAQVLLQLPGPTSSIVALIWPIALSAVFAREVGGALNTSHHSERQASTLTQQLFLVSVLTLFLEMLLIRWISTEIRIFAYLQNTVLVVCFLGLGMGCFTCRKPIHIRQDLLVPLLFLSALLAVPFTRRGLGNVSELLSVLSDLLIWDRRVASDRWQAVLMIGLGLGVTFGIMRLLWRMFVPLGRLLGRLLDDHPRVVWAYSINVAGSLIGIWLFVALSAAHTPPVLWFLVVAALLCFFVGRGRQRAVNLTLLAALIVASWFAGLEPGALEVVWSPYQKLVAAGGRPRRARRPVPHHREQHPLPGDDRPE